MAKRRQSGRTRPRTDHGLKALGLLILALALAALGQWLVYQPETQISLARQLPGWLLFAAGGFLLHRASRPGVGPARIEPDRVPFALEAGLLSLIFIAAVFLRLHGLPQYPNAGFRDEGENGNVAIQLLNGERVDGTDQYCPAYIEQNTQNAAGYFYPVALSFRLFGISILSERYVSVFFGSLAVLAFWALSRALFGPVLALFLAACLAAMRWHLNFSRIGFLGIMTVFLSLPMLLWLWRGLRAPPPAPRQKERSGGPGDLFLGVAVALAVARGFLQYRMDPGPAETLLGLVLGLPLLWCAVRAWKDERSRWFMLSAAALACAMYSYIAARLFVLLVALIVGHWLLTRQRPLRPRARALFWLGLGVFCLGFLGLVLGSVASPSNDVWSRSPSRVLGLIIVVLGALLQVLFWVGQRGLFRGWVRPLGLALGVGLVVAGPLYAYAVRHRVEVDARSYRVSIFNDHDADKSTWGVRLLDNLGPNLGMVNVRGDGNPRHNLPNALEVNPLWAALFALGLFWALANLRDARGWLALTLWQVSLIGGYASMEAPQSYRCITAIPAVLLLLGLALERCRAALRGFFKDDTGLAFGLLLAAVLAFGAGFELRTYFVVQRKDPGVWAEFSADEYLMGKDLKALNSGGKRTRGLVLSSWASSYTFRFMTYPERNYEPFDPTADIPIRVSPTVRGQDFLYILGQDYLPLVGVLEDLYPHGVYKEVRHPYTHGLLYWTYWVSAAEAEKGATLSGGLTGDYYQDNANNTDHPEAAPHWVPAERSFTRVDPFLLFNWTQTPIEGFFSAQWTGSLKAPRGGEYFFQINSNSYAQLELDGKPVVTLPFLPATRQEADAAVHLSAGRHRLRLRYYDARGYARLDLWWKPPRGVLAVVPNTALSPR